MRSPWTKPGSTSSTGRRAPLESDALFQFRNPSLGRRQEHIADLFEERRAELGEEPRARLREPHLWRRRELLPHAAHRLAGRAGCDAALVAEGHVVLAFGEREVVRDARPDRAGAGYDDSSHCSTSARSSAVRPRNGGRTSS